MKNFSEIKKSIRSLFTPITKMELCKQMPARRLVWNEKGDVLLDTHYDDGDYVFQNFSGHISCCMTDCEVRNATFIYHAPRMYFLAGIEPGPGMSSQIPRTCNHIEWKDGELLSGHLKCSAWENGTVTGGELDCGCFEMGKINGGTHHCLMWRGGTFNGGELLCNVWLCGIFNDGTFHGEWRDGVWNGGTFRGEWYGGQWNGGNFGGKVLIGDGTFEWISNKKTNRENKEEK